MYETTQPVMQPSHFDATTYQNALYGNSSGFDPGPIKTYNSGYPSESSNEASGFYPSYIGSSSTYPQPMPSYGCREPPSYMETSFFHHSPPGFIQNLGASANYYRMTANRHDYNTAAGLMSITPRNPQDSFLSKSNESGTLTYNGGIQQLDSAFTNDTNSTSAGGMGLNPVSRADLVGTANELSSPLGDNHLEHRAPQHSLQQRQQPPPEAQQPLNVTDSHHTSSYRESPDSSGVYSNVKVEISTNSSAADIDTQSHISHQTPSTNFQACQDIKTNFATGQDISHLSHSLQLQHQQTHPTQLDTSLLPEKENPPQSPQNFLSQQNPTSSTAEQEVGSPCINNPGKDVQAVEDASKAINPAETVDGKPTMSYIALIAKAILESEQRRLNLGSIYHWIEKHYPFYKNKGQGWRNSVRHNLSLNDCFIKAGRCEDGKGNYWAIHPANIQDFIRGDFRQRRRSRRRGRKKECDLGLYHVPNGYLQPPAPPLTTGMALNPAALSSIYSPYTEAERRAYRLDEALLRQSMNNPWVKWYHPQTPGAPPAGSYGLPSSPHHGCSAPGGVYPPPGPPQWTHQSYATDTTTQNMYPALTSAFPR